MPGIVPVGNSQFLNASATPSYVTYGPNISNTFRIANTDNTLTLYVAVYNSKTQADAFVKPTSGNPNVPGCVVITPGWNEVVSGNFGAQNTNTIYVCVVAAASGTFDCVVTPVRD